MNSLSDAQLFAFLEHLDHCPSCRARFSGNLLGATLYEEAFDIGLTQALAAAPCIRAERNAAPDNLADLLRLPASDRELKITQDPRFKTYSLASCILDRSEKLVAHNPRASLAMARLAYSVTAQIDPRSCGGTEALADLGAYALAMEGNAERVCGNMAGALGAFTRARKVQERGGVDPDLIGQIDLVESSLRRDVGETQEALSLLERAAESFLILQDHQRWLSTQVNRANALMVQGNFDEACALLNEILSQTEDPQVIFCIRHNLASSLALAGRWSEAARLQKETREPDSYFSAPLITSRRRWLEAIIAHNLGEDRRAGNLLEEVGAELDDRGYAFDAALVRLELAKIQARRGGEPLRVC